METQGSQQDSLPEQVIFDELLGHDSQRRELALKARWQVLVIGEKHVAFVMVSSISDGVIELHGLGRAQCCEASPPR